MGEAGPVLPARQDPDYWWVLVVAVVVTLTVCGLVKLVQRRKRDD